MEASPWEAAPLRLSLRSTMSKTQLQQSELVIEFRRYTQNTIQSSEIIVSLNLLSFFLLFFNVSQNSSLDALLKRLPSFLERLNSQNNVKVCVFTLTLILFPLNCRVIFEGSIFFSCCNQLFSYKCFHHLCSGVVQ